MAISWSAWEGHLRVGVEVTWESISHSEGVATATVKYYTGVDNWSFNDGQTLTLTGAVTGTLNFTNTQGANTTVLRATRTYDYTYPSSSYGTSPGSRTFGASLSGSYNGATPSKSVSSSIPARPYAAPAEPTGVTVSRGSDTSATVKWTNHATSGEPYSSHTLQRSLNGGSWTTVSSSISASATSYAYGTATDSKYRFQVRANNSEGSSDFVASGDYYTTPSTPTTCVRTGANGDDQVITWSNNSPGYSEYKTEVWRSTNGVWSLLTEQVKDVTSYTDTYPATHPSDSFQYKVRHKTTSGIQGTLYSPYSNTTTSTSGVTSAPDRPTDLAPTGSFNGLRALVLSWTYNSTDGSAQTQFQIRHGLSTTGPWTTVPIVTSGASSWTLPAGTYSNGQNIYWQVRTRGSSTTSGPLSDGFSDWSLSATLTTSDDRKVTMRMNLSTGLPEVNVTDDSWKSPTLLNGWVNFGGTYQTARYCKRGGVVYVEGLVKNGSGGAAILNLPDKHRPEATLLRTVITGSMTTLNASAGTDHTHLLTDVGGRVNVLANGDIVADAGMSNSYVSIDLSFPVD